MHSKLGSLNGIIRQQTLLLLANGPILSPHPVTYTHPTLPYPPVKEPHSFQECSPSLCMPMCVHVCLSVYAHAGAHGISEITAGRRFIYRPRIVQCIGSSDRICFLEATVHVHRRPPKQTAYINTQINTHLALTSLVDHNVEQGITTSPQVFLILVHW